MAQLYFSHFSLRGLQSSDLLPSLLQPNCQDRLAEIISSYWCIRSQTGFLLEAFAGRAPAHILEVLIFAQLAHKEVETQGACSARA